MYISVEHEEETDFGTLVVTPESDDSFAIAGYGASFTIRLDVYSHEAREIIAALERVAQSGSDNA